MSGPLAAPQLPVPLVLQSGVHGLLPWAPAHPPPELSLRFVLQLHPQLPALSVKFNIYLTNICWESNTAGCKQPRALLEHVEDNFLIQALACPIPGSVEIQAGWGPEQLCLVRSMLAHGRGLGTG